MTTFNKEKNKIFTSMGKIKKKKGFSKARRIFKIRLLNDESIP